MFALKNRYFNIMYFYHNDNQELVIITSSSFHIHSTRASHYNKLFFSHSLYTDYNSVINKIVYFPLVCWSRGECRSRYKRYLFFPRNLELKGKHVTPQLMGCPPTTHNDKGEMIVM